MHAHVRPHIPPTPGVATRATSTSVGRAAGAPAGANFSTTAAADQPNGAVAEDTANRTTAVPLSATAGGASARPAGQDRTLNGQPAPVHPGTTMGPSQNNTSSGHELCGTVCIVAGCAAALGVVAVAFVFCVVLRADTGTPNAKSRRPRSRDNGDSDLRIHRPRSPSGVYETLPKRAPTPTPFQTQTAQTPNPHATFAVFQNKARNVHSLGQGQPSSFVERARTANINAADQFAYAPPSNDDGRKTL